jgi:hypothetical protein
VETTDQSIELCVGSLTMLFEPGGLRYVRLGQREVLRRVYVGVRDQNWRTIEPQLSNLKSEIQADSFRIEFDCKHQQGEIDFRWRGEITGTAAGEINFTMDGEAHSNFLRNRIGLCVLHPIEECAGQPCEVLHTDGTVEHSQFPLDVAPHQPFFDVHALTHEVLPGVRATVRMEGETFETEDQRNWTDYSFKTYSTPLSLPFPVLVKKGEGVSQRVTLQLSGLLSQTPIQSDEIRLRIEAAPIQQLPQIGLGMASHGQPLTSQEIARLQALGLSHLRVELNLLEADFEQGLERAVAESDALEVGLEVALFFSDAVETELQKLIAALQRLKPRVLRWLILHATEKVPGAQLVKTTAEALRQFDSNSVIGTATNAWFTEINRQHTPVKAVKEADWLCYPISPQTHAIDSRTLMENLVGQAATVQNARRLFGSLSVAVSPVTLKPRFSASAPGPNELPPQVDPRQPTLLAAAWTLGSIKYLAESGASGITYYETTGWRGVMELEAGSLLPEQFPSTSGAVFPLWHVLAEVNDFAGGDVLPLQSPALKVAGLALSRDGRKRVLLANLTPQPQAVQFELFWERVRLKRLNEENLSEAMLSPEAFRAKPADEMLVPSGQLALILAPYEVITLDD